MNKPQFCNQTEIDFLRSLNDSELARLLAEFPKTDQAEILSELLSSRTDSELSKDVARKRDKRSHAAEVVIPLVADVDRRMRCLADPELFLRTYNPTGEEGFTTPFAEHHKAMIRAIHERAKSGGDKAVAAPRGDGKSSVAVWMMIYIILAGLIRSAVIIAATRKHAQKLFKRFKKAFLFNDLLAADFPEISACVRDLDGAPQRASKQHVRGEKTQIVWTQDDVVFPHVPGSPYGGVRVAYFGLDSAIRGGRFEFALIDDPETKDVALSDEQNHKVEAAIDSDVAGLAFPDSTISRVILTTVQNRRCYSYRVTDPKIKPTFAGERYGVLKSWPSNKELWNEYISRRQQGQASGDKDGRDAMQFYLDNFDAMNEGAEVSNPHRFSAKSETELDALQAFFNRVSDWGLPRALAELQNDPEEEETPETLNLTAGKVASRLSGLRQNELPKMDGLRITAGLDVGKYYSHWVKIAWFGNATGVVVDYGVMETPGMQSATDQRAVEVALLTSLLNWRNDIIATNAPEFCLIDSGDYSAAVYEFVRRVLGTPFAASKGWDAGRFHMGTESPSRRLFDNCWAGHQPGERLWLYNVNTEHWKAWVHERFATPTMNEANQFNDGSLSLFVSDDKKKHLSFSHHIVSEMREEMFIEGKGLVRKWREISKNNHYLDATALACTAAGCLGIRLIPRVSIQEPAKKQIVKTQASNRMGSVSLNPFGQPFLVSERK